MGRGEGKDTGSVIKVEGDGIEVMDEDGMIRVRIAWLMTTSALHNPEYRCCRYQYSDYCIRRLNRI